MSTLWVIGDSTVSSFEDKYYYPRYGYGTMLDKYLNDNVKVVNIALSGRSSKSYLSEPEYNTLINGMKQGDYLLIGFGHNDEKTEKERYTSPVGDYMTEGTFANTLYVNYIRKARNAGCYPILCTPIVRRSASGEWKATELHITQDVAQYKGGDYALAVRELGKAVGVPVIDMTQLTRDEYEKLGSDNTIYLHAWPSNNKLSVDNTHTNIWGARVNAYMIMSAVKELNISGLSENVVNIDNNPLDYKEKFLVSNKDYVPVVFSDKLPDSRLFKDYGEYKAAVFGDVLGEVDDTDFTLGTDANGDMNIAVRNNRGKISAVTDGIAMYYKKVDITEHFTLTATVRSAIELEEPVVIKNGNKYGVKIKAKVPSVNMLKTQINVEIAPIVGTKNQAEDLINYIKDNTKDNPDGIWDTNIFGKTIEQIVNDGIYEKTHNITKDNMDKIGETIEKVMNENSGLVCLIV